MIKFLLFLALNMFTLSNVFANLDNKVNQTPDPNCPLDYFFRGYDYVLGNPSANTADPGWRLSIMDEKRRESCLSCYSSTVCSAQYTVHEMEAELDYFYSLYAKASVSENSQGFLRSSAFTGSSEYQYQKSNVFGANLVNVQAEGACQLYDGGRDRNCHDVKFTTGFKSSVANFPTTTDPNIDPEWFNKVKSFFSSYGTHFMSYGSIGARWSYESLFAQADFEALRSASVNIAVAAEASAEYHRTKGGSAEFESEEVTEMRVMFNAAAYSQRAITIGALPPTDISFGEWANNIDNPIPQKYQLAPLSEFFTPEYFPSDPQIIEKRLVLEAAYELYCASVPGCHEMPKILHISKTEEGKYKTKNSLDIACPSGYTLLSGGCQSEPIPSSDTGWWLIAALKPNDNVYHCTTSMDYYSDPNFHKYYKGLTASASCIEDKYVEDKVIATCEGPSGKQGSECIAWCPIDYQLSGGGCQSSATEENHPWKVSRSAPLYSRPDYGSGWDCRVTEDSWAQNYNKKALGYAVCIKYADGVFADQKLISESSGTQEKFTNGIDVMCEDDYEIISGGCVVPTYPGAEYKEWKTIESQASSNLEGWSCLAQENLHTYVYNQDVRTDALCVKFNK